MLLAEAGAGRTKELEGRRDRLTPEGKFAIFLRVEGLAEGDLDSCLSLEEARRFQDRQDGSEIGHFFLDSVDEARLTGKKLHAALRRFSRGRAERLPRARVLITCRVRNATFIKLPAAGACVIHQPLPIGLAESNRYHIPQAPDSHMPPPNRIPHGPRQSRST
ncbi:hypothetical protein EYW49_15750 [Siculibacillus lacustris]|uniref:Uncharacterized protein n=1 Tax=Siculibacillus lacustris TaxID=1549641 RepID=A0A4Q9VJH6_9HYPH|nr:hypothetical protein [Siculibacillus lacustris]TBW35480.1 hypothetical protein EYW49_15750 [Siculibacillus lacustris]